MILHPKSKIVALRALLAVTWAEERRLLTIINSEQASTEEISKALKDLHKLWSQIVLQLADIEDATVTSAQIALHPIDRRVGNARDDEPRLCAPWECPPNSASRPGAVQAAPGLVLRYASLVREICGFLQYKGPPEKAISLA